MAENPQNSINPIVLPIESVETASRNFLVNDRRTLRSTEITKIVFLFQFFDKTLELKEN